MTQSRPLPEALLRDSAWLGALTRRLTGDATLAEDLHQDVVVAALMQPVPSSAGRSWFARVARNLAAMLRRSGARERARLQRLPEPEPVPSPAALAAAAEQQQRAVAAVLALPQVYRDTVLLRFLKGQSLQETAQAMGVPEETVRTRQRRALEMLRSQLAGEGPPRRGLAMLLGCLLDLGVAMKFKHTFVAVAVLLLSMSIGVGCWLSNAPVVPQPTTAAAATAAWQERSSRPTAAPSSDANDGPLRREVTPTPPPSPTTGSIAVHVTWKDDCAPAAGIAVLCQRQGESGTFGMTDAAGIAGFTDLEANEWRIHLHDWHSEDVRIEPGREVRLVHAMERGRSVHAIVVGANGKPVPGADILVSAGRTEPQWLFPVGRSDEQGRFSCQWLRTYALVGAAHEIHGSSEFRMLMDEQGRSQPEAVILRLPGAAASLRGRVYDRRGRPIAGAWVKLGTNRHGMRVDEHGHLWQGTLPTLRTTAADGSFAASPLPLGECAVEVYRRGFAPHQGSVVLVEHPPELVVVLEPGAVLTGTLRDANGRTISGSVDLDPSDFPRRCSQEVGSDGVFRFEDLPPGEVTATAIARGFPDQKRTFAITGAGIWHWDVVMQANVAIRGRLVDHEGMALAGCWILMPGVSRFAFTDTEGRFVMPESAEVDNTLIVCREPFGPAHTRFTGVNTSVHEQTFTMTAEAAPSATINGICCAADGSPLADVRIQVVQDERSLDVKQISIAANGAFAIGPLPPGRYTVMPQHLSYSLPATAIELGPGQRQDIGRLVGMRWARLSLRLSGTDTACAAAIVELVAGERRVVVDGQGHQRSLLQVQPGSYRIEVSIRGVVQDYGVIDLAEGGEVTHQVAVR